MSADESVSEWIEGLRAGEETAAARLWSRYYERLIALVQRRLGPGPRRVSDEEDVVQSAFATFFHRVQEGQFPRLSDRSNLWPLLVTIAERKALNQRRDQHRQKRGGGRVRGESVFLRGDDSSGGGIGDAAGCEPSPELAASVAEEFRILMGLLDDDLKAIALLKLEGRTNEEVASRIDRSLPTVERRLKLIREKWQRQAP
jgi:RNA polymerase sigma factor (sigma-70 family)